MFFRSVLTLIAGTGAGQLVSLATMPLITRLFVPDQFGQLAVFTSFATIAAGIGALRYEQAIPVAKDDEEAAALVWLSLFLATLAGGVSALLCWFFAETKINGNQVVPDAAMAPWLIPAVVGLIGFRALNYVCIRAQEYRQMAGTQLMRTTARVLGQIIGGLVAASTLVLITAEIAATWFSAALLFRLGARQALRQRSGLRLRTLCLSAKRHYRFALFSTPQGLLNVAVNQSVPLIIAVALGIGPAGAFALMQRVLQAPVFLLSYAMTQVFYGNAAASWSEGDRRSVGRKFWIVTVATMLISLMPAAVLCLWGPVLFQTVFGSEWALAGEMARFWIPALVTHLTVSSVAHTLLILGRQALALIAEIVKALALAGAATYVFAAGTTVDETVGVISLAIALGHVTFFAISARSLMNAVRACEAENGR